MSANSSKDAMPLQVTSTLFDRIDRHAQNCGVQYLVCECLTQAKLHNIINNKMIFTLSILIFIRFNILN